jgi:hypothetical protein
LPKPEITLRVSAEPFRRECARQEFPNGGGSGQEIMMNKLLFASCHQALGELTMDILGPERGNCAAG